MSIYVCRWQNGDFSVVEAVSREDAIAHLDQVGNAEVADLFPLRKFMVHFALCKEVRDLEQTIPVELESFGEETEEFLSTRIYSVYNKTLSGVAEDLPADETVSDQEYQQALSKVTDGLERERKRRWGTNKPHLSEDPAIRKCQELTGMPKVLAERLTSTA